MQLWVRQHCVALDITSQHWTLNWQSGSNTPRSHYFSWQILWLISCASSPDAAQGPQNITRKYSLERAKSESSWNSDPDALMETPTEAAASWFIMISSVQRKLEMVPCHKNSLLSPFTGPDLLILLSHPDWILIFSDETSRNTGETWSHKAQRQKLVSLHQNKILQTYKHFYNRYVQPACATTGDGLYEGLTWLTSNHKSWSKGKIFCDSQNLFSSLFTFFRHC